MNIIVLVKQVPDTANITVDAMKELALVKGSPCTALIKASHVLIAVDG